eukprot:2588216-Rhodomonas_salina.1
MDGLRTTVVDGAAAAGAAGAGDATAATAAGEIWESTSCLAAMRVERLLGVALADAAPEGCADAGRGTPVP